MKINKLLYLFIIVACGWGCGSDLNELPEIELDEIRNVESVNDTLFFKDIRSIHYYNNKIYALESEKSRYFVFDEKGNQISSAGVKGRGPSELLEPLQLQVKNDTVYIFNAGDNSFKLFKNNKYIESISVPNELGQFIGFKFGLNQNQIFLTPFNGSGSVASFEIHSSENIHTFGTFLKSENSRKELFLNSRFVFSYSDQIISVGAFVPNIERYDLQGNLTDQFDFRELEIYQGRNEYLENFKSTPNSLPNVVIDAYLYKDKLFVLPYLNLNDKQYANRIIQFDLKTHPMKPELIYNLGDGGFSGFAVSDDYLWAFRKGYSPGLVQFRLENDWKRGNGD